MAIQPPQRFELDDLTHVEREARTIYAPGATPGDVLVVQSDHSLVAAPGGGSQPQFGQYSGNSVTVADGVLLPLSIDTLFTGDPLLDLSAPIDPAFAAAGIYSWTIGVVSTAPLTPGGFAILTAGVGVLGGSTQITAIAYASQTDNGFFVNGVTAALAGDLFTASVTNHDGVASRDFRIADCVIVKIG